MPTFRKSLRPILAIMIAAAVLMLLLAPLEATAWADGFRAGLSAESTEGLNNAPNGIATIIGPLIKITLLMGVPALTTLGVRRSIGRLRTSSI